MNKQFKLLTTVLAVGSLLLLSGCAHKVKSGQLMNISLGMSKQQIISILGEPKVVRGSMTNNLNQTVDVWEYYIKMNHTSGSTTKTILLFGPLFLIGGFEEIFLFFFSDGKLIKWCNARDHNIKEIQIR